MANILLINSVIREFALPNNVPLGVLYIASCLREAGHEVDVCDLNGLRAINSDREYWLNKYRRKYDIIGISGLIVTYHEQRRYAHYIRLNNVEFGDPIIVSGGGLATSVPEFTAKHFPEVNIFAIGEGEITMLELANGGIPLDKIAGIAYREGKELVFTQPRELIHNLDTLPMPAWDLIPVEDVYMHNAIWGTGAGNSSKIAYEMKRSMNMINSRGCPYNCSFCASKLMGRQYRMRSVNSVISEIIKLKELYNIDFAGFVDDNTTANRDWIYNFCNTMISADLNVKWGCSARVNQVDSYILALMKQAGCEFIGFGVESGNPSILKAMNKKIIPEQASKAIRMVRESGIWANATFIAGYPTETIETLRDTAKFMKDNNCLNSIFYATPYPGTILYEESKDRILAKYGTEDNYIMSLGDATEFRVNLSNMSDAELIDLRKKAMVGVDF